MFVGIHHTEACLTLAHVASSISPGCQYKTPGEEEDIFILMKEDKQQALNCQVVNSSSNTVTPTDHNRHIVIFRKSANSN